MFLVNMCLIDLVQLLLVPFPIFEYRSKDKGALSPRPNRVRGAKTSTKSLTNNSAKNSRDKGALAALAAVSNYKEGKLHTARSAAELEEATDTFVSPLRDGETGSKGRRGQPSSIISRRKSRLETYRSDFGAAATTVVVSGKQF